MRWSAHMRPAVLVQRNRLTTTYAIIEQPSRRTVDAVIGASALMACVDGKPVAQERAALAAILRHHGLLQLYGRRAPLTTYDKAVCQPHLFPEWDAAITQLGTLGAIMEGIAAAHVAIADGVLW